MARPQQLDAAGDIGLSEPDRLYRCGVSEASGPSALSRRRRSAAAAVAMLLAAAGGVHALTGSAGTRAARTSEPVAPRPASARRAATTSPRPPAGVAARKATPAPASDDVPQSGTALIDVPTQSQLPALPNGCEVTSLSMLLGFAQRPVDKLVLARTQDTDRGQPVFAGTQHDFYGISRWGNPNDSFVGRVDGRYGYGIYHRPLARLLDRQLPGRSDDLTGRPFSEVLARIRQGTPVVLWTTTTFRPPSRWVTWATPNGPFRATQAEHAVLLIGYTPGRLVIDNPLSGQRESVQAAPFLVSWQQMGQQALTVTHS